MIDVQALFDSVTPERHVPHSAHGPGTAWPETNCALDLYIELLSLLGHEPEAGLLVALQVGFTGEGWGTPEYARSDLRYLYGIDVTEFTPWRSVLDHAVSMVDNRQLMTIETDAFWLPDTAGLAYRLQHVKTSITPLRIDPASRSMTYLHNCGCFELSGEDFDALWSVDPQVNSVTKPYIELLDVDPHPTPELTQEWLDRRVPEALDRSADGTDVVSLGRLITQALPSVADNAESFHALAFATIRQFGSTAQCIAVFARWWLARHHLDLTPATPFDELADSAQRTQFALARATRGRRVDAGELFDGLARDWDTAKTGLRRALGV